MNLSNSLYKYLILPFSKQWLIFLCFDIELILFKLAMFWLKLLRSINILAFRSSLRIFIFFQFQDNFSYIVILHNFEFQHITFFRYDPPKITFFIINVHPLCKFLSAYLPVCLNIRLSDRPFTCTSNCLYIFVSVSISLFALTRIVLFKS